MDQSGGRLTPGFSLIIPGPILGGQVTFVLRGQNAIRTFSRERRALCVNNLVQSHINLTSLHITIYNSLRRCEKKLVLEYSFRQRSAK